VADFRALGTNGQYQPGLKAEYFNNQDLSGSPVLTRQEAHLSATYPADAPSEVGSSFSVRWSGELMAPVTGEYAVKFQVSSNARLGTIGSFLGFLGVGMTSVRLQSL
jgi:hypothetical protein